MDMKKLIVFFTFMLLFAGMSFALGHKDPREGMHPKKSEYKLSKKEFMALYGKDDSAKALINIFFRDRRIGFYVLPLYPAIVILNGIIQPNPNIGDLAVGHPALLGIVGGVTSLTGAYFLISSSRKALYKELKYYELMGHLSDEYGIQVRVSLYKQTKDCKVPPANGDKVPSAK